MMPGRAVLAARPIAMGALTFRQEFAWQVLQGEVCRLRGRHSTFARFRIGRWIEEMDK